MSNTQAKKSKWLYIALFMLVVMGFIIFRLINPSVGFKYFEPSYLPSNVSIKAKRISITRGYTQVEQNFRTEDWVYSISEYKAAVPIGSADQNLDAQSIKPTCNLQVSPLGMSYRVCHWIDYGRINVHEVKFIKEGTFVNVQIPTTLQEQISINQIDKFVDSFKKKSTVGIPVLRFNGA
jgi:hypothetical protein